MKTALRKGKSPFYGDSRFPHGIARSGHFNKREAQELQSYGMTMQGLYEGTLSPENSEEERFVADCQTTDESSLYAVRLWKKYLDAEAKSRRHHSFTRSEKRSQGFIFDYNDSNFETGVS